MSIAIALPRRGRTSGYIKSGSRIRSAEGLRNYTKTGAARDVEMSPELANELRTHMTLVRDYFESRTLPVPKLFFPSTIGTVLDVDNLNGLFSEICESAGIEGYTLYDLRHTYASLLLMRGASPQYVQKQLGHETLSTTLRYYAHWIPKETKEGYAHLIDAKVGKSQQVTSDSPILTPDSDEEKRVRWQMR